MKFPQWQEYRASNGSFEVHARYETMIHIPDIAKVHNCTLTFPTKLGGRLLRKARLRKKKAKNSKTISFYAVVKMCEAIENKVTLEILSQGEKQC